ncbi:MAG: helix-turn-helix transcriptional regulator [Phycisphaerales bacterium]|nr:helix-turn-helix transcriptional regulator [Phycisphaerales bacterium]
MRPLIFQTPEAVRGRIAAHAKARRLAENLSRRSLSARSGVPESTIKRFETTGHIALNRLLQLASILDGLDEFAALFPEKPPVLIKQVCLTPRQRGRG